MRILILEDSKERIEQFKRKLIGKLVTYVEETGECIKILEDEPVFDYAFLDHDLSVDISLPRKGTGYEVAEWIANNPSKAPRQIIIHSLNTIGATAMMTRLKDAGIESKHFPFLWTKL